MFQAGSTATNPGMFSKQVGRLLQNEWTTKLVRSTGTYSAYSGMLTFKRLIHQIKQAWLVIPWGTNTVFTNNTHI